MERQIPMQDRAEPAQDQAPPSAKSRFGREIIHVEPFSTYLKWWKAPTSAVTRYKDLVYVSGLPPFDLCTGEIMNGTIEQQTECVLHQMKECLIAAGSSLDQVLKCNVYCTSVEHFAAVNAVYAKFFPVDPPARIFTAVPAWPGRFDIEVDCVAVRLPEHHSIPA